MSGGWNHDYKIRLLWKNSLESQDYKQKYVFWNIIQYLIYLYLEVCGGDLHLLSRALFSLIVTLTLEVWQSIFWIIGFTYFFFLHLTLFILSHFSSTGKDSEAPEGACTSSVSQWWLNTSEGCEDRMHLVWEITFPLYLSQQNHSWKRS